MDQSTMEKEEKKNTLIEPEDTNAFKESIRLGLEKLKGLQQDEEPVYVMIMLTDRFVLETLNVWEDLFSKDNVPETAEEILEKVLELRMFNESGEIKWFRSTINKPLYRRECLDDKEKIALNAGNGAISLDSIEFLENPEEDERFYWDEVQYLDIDTKRTKTQGSDVVFATGGGSYNLPGVAYDKDPTVTIRNYLAHEPNGRCYVKDWRIVKFSTKE